MIRNISENQIISTQDFGARIFVFLKDEWVEIENKTVYSNDLITLDPNKNFDPTKIAGIFVLPDLPDDSNQSYIRIYLVGTVVENGQKIKEIASYIDLKLNP